MEYRTLGTTGTVVSTYALGTVTFGAESDEAESFALLDRYRAAGGTFVDTANVYAAGSSEMIIGRWLRSRVSDGAQMVIATKGRFPTGPGPNDLGSSRRHLSRALDASLANLRVDHIDLYQLHAWDPLTPIDETLRFLDDAVSAGKIGQYGLSNFTGWQVTKAAYRAQSRGMQAPSTVQLQYNLLVRGIESEIVPAALDAGIGILAWSPLAGGWLTGKYRRDERPGASTRYGKNPSRGVQSWSDRNSADRTWKTIEVIAEIATARGLHPSQVALSWVEQQQAVTAVILGARTVRQLDSNLAAAQLTLDSGEIQRLTSISMPVVDEYPYGEPGEEQRRRNLEGGR